MAFLGNHGFFYREDKEELEPTANEIAALQVTTEPGVSQEGNGYLVKDQHQQQGDKTSGINGDIGRSLSSGIWSSESLDFRYHLVYFLVCALGFLHPFFFSLLVSPPLDALLFSSFIRVVCERLHIISSPFGLSVSLSVSLSVGVSICLFVCLSVNMSLYLSGCVLPPVCLPVNLSVYLSLSLSLSGCHHTHSVYRFVGSCFLPFHPCVNSCGCFKHLKLC